jgi:hypothetical protein
MRVFHRTAHADAILAKGFKDGRGRYIWSNDWDGLTREELLLAASFLDGVAA